MPPLSPKLGTPGVPPMYTHRLYLSLDSHWYANGRDLLPGRSAIRTGCNHQGGSAVQEPILLSRTYFSRALVQAESAIECVVCGSAWVVLRHGLKLSTGCVQAPRRCTPRSATTCALPRATQHELQNDLQMAATCTGLGGAQVRLSCKPRPATTDAKPGAT